MNTIMDIAHIDLGNQIENPWNKPSVLAVKFNGFSYGIKIKEDDKKRIRNKICKQRILPNPACHHPHTIYLNTKTCYILLFLFKLKQLDW